MDETPITLGQIIFCLTGGAPSIAIIVFWLWHTRKPKNNDRDKKL